MDELGDLDLGDESHMQLPSQTWLEILDELHGLTAMAPGDGGIDWEGFADQAIERITTLLGRPPMVELLTRSAEQGRMQTMAEMAKRPVNSHPADILDGLYHGLDENRLEAGEEFSHNMLLLLARLRM